MAILALASALTGTVPAAAAVARQPETTPAPSLTLGATELPSDLARTDVAGLQAALETGLQRADIEFSKAGPATQAIVLRVQRERSDYDVTITVVADEGERTIAAATETCELCGMAELRETVIAVAARLRQRLDLATDEATIVVTSDPAGATVLLDGVPVGTTPLRTGVTTGQHTVVVRSKGFHDESADFATKAGAQSQFSYALRRQRYRRWVPWVTLGAGVAMLGTAAALLAVDGNPVENDCNPDIEGNCEFLRNTLPGGASAAVVGSALTIAGVVLAVAWRDRRQPTERRASLGRGGLSLRF